MKKPLTNQGFLFIILEMCEKTLTKTVEYTRTAKRTGEGESPVQVRCI